MKSVRVLLLLAGLILGGQLSLQAQGWSWAKPLQPGLYSLWPYQQGWPWPTQRRLLATDPQGNSYVAGSFAGPLTLAGTVVPAQGGRWNLYLAKYDSAGSLLWVRTGFSADTAGAYAMALTLDSRGRPLLVTRAPSQLTVGSTTQPGDRHLVSFDAAGGLRWIRPLAPNGVTTPSLTSFSANDVRVAANGDILLAGETYAGWGYVILVVCDSLGTYKWSRQGSVGHSMSDVWGGHSAADQAGHYYLMGYSTEGAYIDTAGGNYLPIGDGSFVVQFDQAGRYRWFKTSSTGPGTALVVDSANNLYWAAQNTYAASRLDSLQAPPGFFLAKLDVNGRALWLRGPDRATSGVVLEDVIIDAQGHATAVGHYSSDSLVISGQPMPMPDSSDVLVIRYSPGGQVVGTATGGGNRGDYGYLAGLDGQGNLYVLGQTLSGSGFGGVALQSTPAGNPQQGNYFLAKLRQPAHRARLTGRVYLDVNGNGQPDAGEGAFPRVVSLEEQEHNLHYRVQGAFVIYADTGHYNLRLQGTPPRYYTLTQGLGGYQGRVTAIGQVDSARHFGLAPIANQPDVRVTLSARRPARPGFQNFYRATLENVGTTVQSGTVTLQLDSLLMYQSSNPAAGSVAGNVVTWTYTNLQPLEQRRYEAGVRLPASVLLGTALVSWANVTPLAGDLVPADNTDTLRQVVTGAYDPNDIEVNYKEITPAQVAAGQWLDYTIRFQNLGTDTAFTVVVRDTLDQAMLSSGVQLRSLSHPGSWSVDSAGVLTVEFPDIHLPHARVDSLGSMGYVRFATRVQRSLVVGDVIRNQAHIFFDFNAPVATNVATTLVSRPTGLTRSGRSDSWSLRPNPARQTVHISGVAGDRTELVDGLGRVVRVAALRSGAATLDISGLAPGLYLVRCRGMARRLVVE